jgi:hypothetical protein
MAFFSENVVAAIDTFENLSVLLDDADEFLAGNLFHTFNSNTSSPGTVSIT